MCNIHPKDPENSGRQKDRVKRTFTVSVRKPFENASVGLERQLKGYEH